MKLITYEKDEKQFLGRILEDGTICCLDTLGIHFDSMNERIERVTPEQFRKDWYTHQPGELLT